jgi:hypothetical protein
MLIRQFHAKHGACQDRLDAAFYFDVLFTHILFQPTQAQIWQPASFKSLAGIYPLLHPASLSKSLRILSLQADFTGFSPAPSHYVKANQPLLKEIAPETPRHLLEKGSTIA